MAVTVLSSTGANVRTLYNNFAQASLLVLYTLTSQQRLEKVLFVDASAIADGKAVMGITISQNVTQANWLSLAAQAYPMEPMLVAAMDLPKGIVTCTCQQVNQIYGGVSDHPTIVYRVAANGFIDRMAFLNESGALMIGFNTSGMTEPEWLVINVIGLKVDDIDFTAGV
jgi:hypothetical protein